MEHLNPIMPEKGDLDKKQKVGNLKEKVYQEMEKNLK